jgi:uncharacterized protein (DUF1697 family)
MPRYAVLLRGVNVGVHAQLAMADFKRVLEGLGYADVWTYLRSGNAVVTAPGKDPGRLAKAIRAALKEELGKDPAVLVRTGPELAAVIEANPFPDAVAKPTTLHVAFLSEQPEPANLARLDPAGYLPDEFQLGDRVLYVRYPNGAGRSKLGPTAFARLKVDATARNWNTVVALADRTAG